MKTRSNLSELSRLTGADRSAIKRWLDGAGLKPVKTDGKTAYWSTTAACAIIEPRARKGASRKAEPNIDPVTGLTWFQLLTKEKALASQRENEEAAAVQSEQWMEVEQHHKILSAVVSRLENIPGKARSELGLSDTQAVGLRRMLDEARTEAAAKVREMK